MANSYFDGGSKVAKASVLRSLVRPFQRENRTIVCCVDGQWKSDIFLSGSPGAFAWRKDQPRLLWTCCVYRVGSFLSFSFWQWGNGSQQDPNLAAAFRSDWLAKACICLPWGAILVISKMENGWQRICFGKSLKQIRDASIMKMLLARSLIRY